MADVFLTIPEVAALLRTTPKGVYYMVERGQLAGVVRIGRRLLVRRDVLLRSLDDSSNDVGTTKRPNFRRRRCSYGLRAPTESRESRD
jgi:excisionase family DNA binding protein